VSDIRTNHTRDVICTNEKENYSTDLADHIRSVRITVDNLTVRKLVANSDLY
jgi:hypothetical protein